VVKIIRRHKRGGGAFWVPSLAFIGLAIFYERARALITKFDERTIVGKVIFYKAGEEVTKLSIGSHGLFMVAHKGNGSPTLQTRVYCDGELTETMPCNKESFVFGMFRKNLEVKIYSKIAQEARNSDLYIVLCRRPF